VVPAQLKPSMKKRKPIWLDPIDHLSQGKHTDWKNNCNIPYG